MADPIGRILVVEDDFAVRDVVCRYLEHAGHQVSSAADGETALRLIAERLPDLVVLDLMLPGVSGLDVCRQLRTASTLPVVMLTALGEESDRVLGLELGADDYVVKPFSPKELTLRVGSVLRRAKAGSAPQPDVVLVDRDLRVDTGARRAELAGTGLMLTSREFELLVFLLEHQNQAFSRADLLAKVWGWDFGDQSTVTVHVRRLREKIETSPARPHRIVTVWGVGYRYDGEG